MNQTLINFAKLDMIDYTDLQLFANDKTLFYTLGGGTLGATAGLLKAKKKIKEQENELNRKLTDEEKKSIYLKYIGGGTALGGIGGSLLNIGLNPNSNANNGKGLIGKLDSKLQNTTTKYATTVKTKDKLLNRWLRGISYEDQALFKKHDDQLAALGEMVKYKNAWDMDDTERAAFDAMRNKKLKIGAAREAMIIGAGTLALNHIIKPIMEYTKKEKKNISQDRLYNIALALKNQGKSPEEIKDILKRVIDEQ